MNWVYVLELENNKYYVGYTSHLKNRLKKHKKGGSCNWVDKHPFKKVVEVRKALNKNLERKTTLEYMVLKGWRNVRGGAWSQVNLKNPPRVLRPL